MYPGGVSSPELHASLLTFAFHLKLLVELDRLLFSATKKAAGGGRCVIQYLSDGLINPRRAQTTHSVHSEEGNVLQQVYTAALRLSPVYTEETGQSSHYPHICAWKLILTCTPRQLGSF